MHGELERLMWEERAIGQRFLRSLQKQLHLLCHSLLQIKKKFQLIYD